MSRTAQPSPFADPIWYTRGDSPYYDESHVRLSKEVRKYVETFIDPYCSEWEHNGGIPHEVRNMYLHLLIFLCPYRCTFLYITFAPTNQFADYPLEQAHQHFSQQGYMAASVFPLAKDHLQGMRLPGGIKPDEWNEYHDLILMDEISRCGYVGIVFGMAAGNIIGLPPVLNFGTAAQKARFVPDTLKGKTKFCLGVTEPDAGSDVAGIVTTATRKGDVYVVNGAKKWITNGIWADYCTAAVRTGGPSVNGISALVIPLNSRGVSRRKLYNSGVAASGMAYTNSFCSKIIQSLTPQIGSTYLEFDDVEVPVENLLGQENQGFKIIMSSTRIPSPAPSASHAFNSLSLLHRLQPRAHLACHLRATPSTNLP